jgi:hypothetical protein
VPGLVTNLSSLAVRFCAACNGGGCAGKDRANSAQGAIWKSI